MHREELRCCDAEPSDGEPDSCSFAEFHRSGSADSADVHDFVGVRRFMQHVVSFKKTASMQNLSFSSEQIIQHGQ